MRGMNIPPKTLWDRDGLHVWAERSWSGGLVISGQHLMEGSEYEYAITVGATDAHKVAESLGTPFNLIRTALATAYPTGIRPAGEMAWLKGIGVEGRLWSRFDG